MSFPRIEGYVVTEKLGSGSYSTVYKAHTKVGARSTVAVKCIDKARVKHSGAAVDNLVTEIRLLKTLAHPHIVHMKEFTWDDKNIYIITEYCCGGDLSRYIKKYGRVPEKQVLYFLQQLASALKFLREKGVVHMDLKPHNLLLQRGSDGRYTLKVADFGFAQHMTGSGMRSVRGSPLYMAPEMVAGNYDARVDLWSVGVIMYECLFGRAPYSSATLAQLVDKIARQEPIRIPAGVSPGCRALLSRLLQHDPDRRISYEEFFADEYLDLDHMPTKENYDKAVGLIKRAVELDAAGRLAAALEAYADSLRYLLPAVGAESDPVRRGALTDKLTRYMERAEEIKAQLAGGAPTRGLRTVGGSQAPERAPAQQARPRGCCAGQASADGIAGEASERSCAGGCACRRGCSGQRAAGAGEVSGAVEVPAEGPGGARGARPRGVLARLLRRDSPPPQPPDGACEESADKSANQRASDDSSNDACRIT